MKLKVDDARVRVTTRFAIEGSTLAGTVQSRALEFDCRVSVTSPEPPEKIAHLIRVSEQTCFVMQSLVTPVKVNSTTILNGEPLRVGAS